MDGWIFQMMAGVGRTLCKWWVGSCVMKLDFLAAVWVERINNEFEVLFTYFKTNDNRKVKAPKQCLLRRILKPAGNISCNDLIASFSINGVQGRV